MGELLGYARVSTSDQSAASQVDPLRSAGVERVWTDVASGVQARGRHSRRSWKSPRRRGKGHGGGVPT